MYFLRYENMSIVFRKCASKFLPEKCFLNVVVNLRRCLGLLLLDHKNQPQHFYYVLVSRNIFGLRVSQYTGIENTYDIYNQYYQYCVKYTRIVILQTI